MVVYNEYAVRRMMKNNSLLQPNSNKIDPYYSKENKVDNTECPSKVVIGTEPQKQDENSIKHKQHNGYNSKQCFHGLRFIHELLLVISPITLILDWGEHIIEKRKQKAQVNHHD